MWKPANSVDNLRVPPRFRLAPGTIDMKFSGDTRFSGAATRAHRQASFETPTTPGESMSDSTPPPGAISWTDLTIPNADEVRDFYAEVVGWTAEPLDMGGYSDYVMKVPSTGTGVAGVCHARGTNTGLPPQWLIYITVADLDASVAACRAHGGSIIKDPTPMGEMGRFCVIRDPGGAVAALYQHPR
jgi:predicted enzyme related to lactoylglutathione lyase